MGVYMRTTGPGCPPSVLLWVQVLLSWGPVLLQDPSRRGRRAPMDHNRRRPSEEADLRAERRQEAQTNKLQAFLCMFTGNDESGFYLPANDFILCIIYTDFIYCVYKVSDIWTPLCVHI